MDKYLNTQDQINKELGSMHQRMKDPILHEQKDLENKHTENVRKQSEKYGV